MTVTIGRQELLAALGGAARQELGEALLIKRADPLQSIVSVYQIRTKARRRVAVGGDYQVSPEHPRRCTCSGRWRLVRHSRMPSCLVL
jgi:hypothetical protein